MTPLAATGDDFEWLKARTRCALTPGARGVKVVDAESRTRGVVCFDMWTEAAAHAHMAVDTPVAWRALLPAAFDYVFNQAGKSLLLGVIPAHNVASADFTRHVGFREAYRVPDGWAPGDDLLLFEMRRDECRFLSSARKAA